MKKITTLIIALGLFSTQMFAQTWIEKSNNGLKYGVDLPPTTGFENDFSEPYDSTWRKGNTGIGTLNWPKTKLQVHSNDDIDNLLDVEIPGIFQNYSNVTALFSNGGVNVTATSAVSVVGATYRTGVANALNYGGFFIASGDEINKNTGVIGYVIGNDNFVMDAVEGVAIGNNVDVLRGVHGQAVSDGGGILNIGVRGQCNTSETDINSVNIGVQGRGVGGGDEAALVSIGVEGHLMCGNAGGSQFNAAIYGNQSDCWNDTTTFGGAPYPTGNFAGYFDGDVHINGVLTGGFSDMILKENITSIHDVLKSFENINIYRYNFKSDMGINLPKGEEFGVIAQELEEIYPELVLGVTVMENDGSHRNFANYKTVKYIQFIPLLIQAIKETNKKIDEFDIDKHLTEIDKLKKEIELLKNNFTEAAISRNTEQISYLKAYPNPSNSGFMNIEILKMDCSDCSLIITDLSGKLIEQIHLRASQNSVELKGNNYAAGIYQLNLISKGNIVSNIKIVFLN